MRDEGSDVVMDKLVFPFPTSCAADIENVKQFTEANFVMTHLSSKGHKFR